MKSDLMVISGCHSAIFGFVSVINVWCSVDGKEGTVACRMHMLTRNRVYLAFLLLLYVVASFFNVIFHVILCYLTCCTVVVECFRDVWRCGRFPVQQKLLPRPTISRIFSKRSSSINGCLDMAQYVE